MTVPTYFADAAFQKLYLYMTNYDKVDDIETQEKVRIDK